MPRISAATISEHRAQTEERILAAVSRLARERGIDEISMTEVAAAAGITRTVLYNYFPDKAALLLAFTERVTSYFIQRYEAELPTDATAAVRLSAFVHLQLEGLMAHPHPAAAELGATLGPDAYQALADHVAPMQRVLCDIVQAGMDSGEFDETDAEGASRLILAAIGAQRVPLLRGQTTLDEAWAAVARFTLRALGVDRAAVAELVAPPRS
ncbi:TetR/AcrR family transcriptional regulator [Bailinhaonella thermotolerans]|uniref:TetR/AcrR family transcriptional regulator n=1 Tax=Bailinhaonella thermotolerans TaxID=1070861 RepID=A0A3A4BBX3_9ACTN|nr:TetR/AcrR family transcriptional regulator [Bailinhaonella thermotolerans]RJL31678.1 TetR/AcrR family transcriptional regulator [Bailinhaonella thermotolerans]